MISISGCSSISSCFNFGTSCTTGISPSILSLCPQIGKDAFINSGSISVTSPVVVTKVGSILIAYEETMLRSITVGSTSFTSS